MCRSWILSGVCPAGRAASRGLRWASGRLALLAGLLGLSAAAPAFESDEHSRLSTLAVTVAQAYVQARPGLTLLPTAADALSAIAPVYGHLTQCVDFFLYPEKLLSFGLRLRDQRGPTRVPVPPPGGFHDLAHPLPQQILDECQVNFGAGFLQASHSNHAHFQHDLLMSLRVWRLMAVATARLEHNPYGGLLLNAVADHYLQDFFAPGHVVTPRDRLTDLPATANHDLANQMGALFTPTLTPAVRAVLDFVCTPAPSGEGPGTPCRVPAAVQAVLAPAALGLGVTALETEAAALRAGQKVLLRGDSFLAGPQQARQRLLMLVVQVAAIVEVLTGQPDEHRMDFQYGLGGGLPVASTEFGQYNFTHEGQRYAALLGDTPAQAAASTATAVLGGQVQPSPFTPCSLGGCNDRLYALRTRAPIFSLSAQRESVSAGSSHARNVVGLEAAAFGWLWDASRLSRGLLGGIEVIPVLGWTRYQQGPVLGDGPTLRLTASVPETEAALSAYARWLTHPDPVDGQANRRLSFGLRADAGFSGYFTFFITAGRDHGVNASGRLESGRMWGAGLRVGAPLTRLNPGGWPPCGGGRVFNRREMSMDRTIWRRGCRWVCCWGLLGATLMLGGCAGMAQQWLYKDYAVRPLDGRSGNTYLALARGLQAAGLKADGTPDAPLMQARCFGAGLSADEKASCRAERNQAVAALVIDSESLCLDHRKTLYGNEATWNLSLGTFTNLFAGAASVVAHEKTKSVLAALALFSNSERSLVNETVYKQLLITAVDRKIVEMRETRAQTLYTALKLDLDTYSVPEALRDVIALHGTCSFMTGLQKALEEGTQAGSAQRILRLRAQVQTVGTELAVLKGQSGATTTLSEQISGLQTRLAALHTALSAEELK